MKSLRTTLSLFIFSLFALSSTGVAQEGGSGNKFGIYVGSNIPFAAQYGLEYMYNPSYSFALEGGSLAADVSNTTIALSKVEVLGRWHMFASAFYLGLGAGSQTLSVEATATTAGYTAKAKAEVKNSFITPRVGWLWYWGGGFNVGLDFGYQINSGANTTVSSSTTDPSVLNDPEYQQKEQDTKDAGNKFGNSAYPTFTWIRVGYLF